jgi:hypothetical protein
VVEERARHSGMDKGVEVKKRNGGGRRLLWQPGGASGEEKGRGSRSGGATRRRLAVGPGPHSRAASRSRPGRGARRSHALFEQGREWAPGRWRVGPGWQWEREARERVGREKKWSGLSPDEQ